MRKLASLMLFLVVSLLSSCGTYQFNCTNGKCYIENSNYELEFQLKGSESLQIPLYGEYQESGVMILLDDKDISDEVIMTGKVDTNTSGIYEIKYVISINNKNYSKIRTVQVMEESLFNFYLVGSTELTVEYGSNYVEDGYVAIKNDTNENLYLDVLVSGNVNTYVPGTYVLTYKLEYYTETFELERIVTVLEYNNFDFELNGTEKVHIYFGNPYEDDGVNKAYDNLDRINYIDQIDVLNKVDIDKPGIYNVVYSVTVHGIEFKLEREVEVLADTLEFRIYGDELIYHTVGEAYHDLGGGVYINDFCYMEYENDLSSMVDVNQPGTYKIYYASTVITTIGESVGKFDYYAVRTVIVV